MNVLVIGDIHGLTSWKLQVNSALFSYNAHVVFIGDYVDSHKNTGITSDEMLENLKEIIELKKTYPDRITLLLGNHDYAYVFAKTFTTGFDISRWEDYRQLFNDNWSLFQLAWGHQNGDKYTLITHAGLTQPFYEMLIDDIIDPESIMNDILVKEAETPWQQLPLHEILNYYMDKISFLWVVGPMRSRGLSEHLAGSIIWADKHELIAHRYKGIDQIVGHTNSKFLHIQTLEDDKIYFVDIHTQKDVIGLMLEV